MRFFYAEGNGAPQQKKHSPSARDCAVKTKEEKISP